MAIVNKTLFVLLGLAFCFSSINAAEKPAAEKPKETEAAEDKLVSIKEAPVALQKLGEGVLKWLQQQKQDDRDKIDFSRAVFRYDKDENSIVLEINARDFQVYRLNRTKRGASSWAKELHVERGPDVSGIVIRLALSHGNRSDYQVKFPHVFEESYWDLYLNVIDVVRTKSCVELRCFKFRLSKQSNVEFCAKLSQKIQKLAETLDLDKIKSAVK